MRELGSIFHCLFELKINFSVWKNFVVDLLVQQGIDDPLEKTKAYIFEVKKWVSMKKKALSSISLSIAPEIKYNYWKETDPNVLLEKLQATYALKSLTNKMLLR